MSKSTRVAVCGAIVLMAASVTSQAAPIGTKFTYQGRLVFQGQPATGNYDFNFSVFSQATEGVQHGPTLNQVIGVDNGLFTTMLDFGNVFTDGQERWLEIEVKAVADGGPHTTLAPRQELTVVPYALDLKLPFVRSANTNDPGVLVDLANSGDGSALKLTTNVVSPNAGLRVTNNTSGSGIQVRSNCDQSEAGVKIFNVGPPNVVGRGLFVHSVAGVVERAPEIPPEQFAGGMCATYSAASPNVIGDGPGRPNGVMGPLGTVIGSIFVGEIGGWGYGLDSVGVIGQCPNGSGVFGTTDSLSGATNTNPYAVGVRGYSANGTGIRADTQFGTAVHGHAVEGSAYAGLFEGRVQVDGELNVTGVKNFLIDHPLDPDHKYLAHASIESAEMLNLYRGNVTLDSDGAATVILPAWFEALNRDFSYQLTSIGAPAPGLYVAEKVRGGKFRIAGGPAGSEVSWILTGVRHDRYATEHPFEVERLKPEPLVEAQTAQGAKP